MDEHNDWLEGALEPLRNPPRAHAWPSVAEVQRSATRRRHRHIVALSSVTSVLLAVALVVGFAVFTSGDGSPPLAASGGIQRLAGPDGSTHLVADVKVSGLVGSRQAAAEIALAEENFALELTRLQLSGAPESNVLLSPMSAHIDLAMLELGAAGATAPEIATALQTSGMSPSQQAAAWNGLLQDLFAGESAGELHVANSLWVEQGLQVEAAFLRQLASTFGNNTYQVNFHSPSAEQAINAWVAQETAGRIKVLFVPGQLVQYTELVLANALHFHAAWEKPLFREATVSQGPFYPASGGSISVPMLVDSQNSFLFDQAPTYNAVQLPYTNGRFAAMLIEPTSGSMSSFLDSLNSARLATMVASMHEGSVNLSMPELKLSVRESLQVPLSSMGMAETFYSADFSPMLGALGARNQAIGVVEQAATLDVNKWGTDAAAATGVSVIPTAVRRSATMVFDHPYLFLLRDTKTGTILFSSVVNDPAAA